MGRDKYSLSVDILTEDLIHEFSNLFWQLRCHLAISHNFYFLLCHHLSWDEGWDEGWKRDENDDNNLLTWKYYGDDDEDEDDLQLLSDDLQLLSDDLQLLHHHVTTYNFCVILTTYL